MSLIEQVIDQLIILKPCVISCLVCIGGFFIFFLINTSIFKWTGKNIKIMGFFYGIETKDALALGANLVKIFVMVSIALSRANISLVHLVLYGLAAILYIVIRHRFSELPLQIINSAVILGVMYISVFLASYLQNVLFDRQILIILVALLVFLFFYCIYDVGWCVMHIATDIDMKGNKKLDKLIKKEETEDDQ